MNRPFDEHALRDALHSALDNTPVDEVTFDRVAAAGRRRQLAGTAGVGAAVLVVAGAASLGLSGLGGPGGPDTGVGAGPMSSAQPSGYPAPSVHPGPSGFPPPSGQPLPPPSASSPTSPRSTAKPTSAAGYCPIHQKGGRIDWPDALLNLQTDEPEWNGPADGPFLPFDATRALVCRYDDDSKLVGAADVTDRAAVRRLQAPVNAATTIRTENPCTFDGTAWVTFVNRDHGKTVWVDLSSCDAWWMPYSISITGGFTEQVRSLTPNGSGLKRRS